MSLCLLPSNAAIKYSEKSYIFTRVDADPLEKAYVSALLKKKQEDGWECTMLPIKVDSPAQSSLPMNKSAPLSSVQWNLLQHGQFCAYSVGPQAFIESANYAGYFFPIPDRFALSIVIKLPSTEFAVLIDRRPLWLQDRTPARLPGYCRLGTVKLDESSIHMRGLKPDDTWEEIPIEKELCSIIQQHRQNFLRRYWCDN